MWGTRPWSQRHLCHLKSVKKTFSEETLAHGAGGRTQKHLGDRKSPQGLGPPVWNPVANVLSRSSSGLCLSEQADQTCHLNWDRQRQSCHVSNSTSGQPANTPNVPSDTRWTRCTVGNGTVLCPLWTGMVHLVSQSRSPYLEPQSLTKRPMAFFF